MGICRCIVERFHVSFFCFFLFIKNHHIFLFSALICYVRFQIHFKKINVFRETLTYQFDRLVEKIPNKTAIIYHGHRTRFIDLQKKSNQIANWVEQSLNLGLDDDKLPQIDDGKGATLKQHQIGLMLGNAPEIVAFILGIAKVRAASVLFNTNHRRDLLLNAIDATHCKVLIFERKYLDAIQEIVEQLPEEMKFFMYDRNWRNELNNNTHDNLKYDEENYWLYDGINKVDLIARAKVDNFAPILEFYSEEAVEKEYTYELSDNVKLFGKFYVSTITVLNFFRLRTFLLRELLVEQ